jgi:hypothetical protein
MVHVSIQHLLTMSQSHASDALQDVIEWCPECFNDFSIDLFCSMYVTWGKAGQTQILMPMDMKEPYASIKLQRVRNG